jgi:LAGLIDADG DNA endonuclease family protein
MSEKFAYFLGLLLGDGSVGSVKVPSIYLVGDLVEERGFYDYLVIPLINELFKIRPYSYVRKGKSAYAVHFKSKRLVEYLVSQLDFPCGGVPKYLPRPMAIFPEGIRLAFIRGLFDADGSLVFSRKTYREHEYPTIEIKTVSRQLGLSVKDLLLIAGFRSSLNKSAESWVMRINGKAMLERWMEKIGSRNIKHLTRYLVWKKQGVCPPNTTVGERMLTLKDWDMSSMNA